MDPGDRPPVPERSCLRWRSRRRNRDRLEFGTSEVAARSGINVRPSRDDDCMGNAVAGAAVVEGLRASVAGLDARFLEDVGLDRAGSDVFGANAPDVAGSGGEAVDVLGRKSELRLQRLALWKQ